VRIEPGSKDDFLFTQALNLMKGLPVKGEHTTEPAAPKTADAKK
jgi:hypothetical protein